MYAGTEPRKRQIGRGPALVCARTCPPARGVRTIAFMSGAPVVMLASGTRGDVQPFLALAVGLSRAGVPVVIAAAPRFRALVETRGIGFAALEGNPSDLMAGASGSMAASLSGGAMQGTLLSPTTPERPFT